MERELLILRLSKLGEGVAEVDGRTVFVEDALPGERVRARIEQHGKVLRAQLLEVLEASADRRAPACPRAALCGGCDWLHLDEPAQRRAKEEIALSALEHLGQVGRSGFTLLPTVASPKALGYRRRAVLHFSGDALGLYARKSHHCLPVDVCPALEEPLSALPGDLAPYLRALKADATAVHLLTAEGKASFAVLLETAVKPKHEEAAEAAVRALGLRGAVLVPKEGSPVLLGKPVLRTPAPMRPEVPLFLRPDAFSQANAEANEALVAAAVDALSPSGGDRVLELYAGNGNFSFAVAHLAQRVLAVESGAVSVALGRRGAPEGRVGNLRFVLGDARKVAQGLVKEGAQFDAVLLDPPRTGAPDLAPLLRSLGAKRVVYVACDPAALARDAAELRRCGYSPLSLQLVDMFPQTRHIEAVMAFSRMGADGR